MAMLMMLVETLTTEQLQMSHMLIESFDNVLTSTEVIAVSNETYLFQPTCLLFLFGITQQLLLPYLHHSNQYLLVQPTILVELIDVDFCTIT
jgi:hypothetical protein